MNDPNNNLEIPFTKELGDYIINARDYNKLVYCRYGEKYIQDIEKRKNANVSFLN